MYSSNFYHKPRRKQSLRLATRLTILLGRLKKLPTVFGLTHLTAAYRDLLSDRFLSLGRVQQSGSYHIGHTVCSESTAERTTDDRSPSSVVNFVHDHIRLHTASSPGELFWCQALYTVETPNTPKRISSSTKKFSVLIYWHALILTNYSLKEIQLLHIILILIHCLKNWQLPISSQKQASYAVSVSGGSAVYSCRNLRNCSKTQLTSECHRKWTTSMHCIRS